MHINAGRRSSALAVVLAAFFLLFVGPAGAEDRLQGMVEPVVGKKPYRIGYASADMNSDFFIGLAYGVTDEAKRANVELVRIVSAGGYGKVAEQIAELEQLGTLNLDAVIVGGSAFNGYDKVIERLTEKGTKVVALGSPISAPKTSLGLVQDENKIGATLAAAICQKKPNAKILTLPGPPGVEWSKRRFDGFKAEAAKCSATLVGNTFAGNVSIEEGQRQAGDLLVKYPDVDFIYAAPGVFAVGVAQQAKRMQAKIPVVTGTITRRTVDLMKDGSIAVVVSEPPILKGRAVLQYTVRLLNGDPLPNLVSGVLPYPVAITPNLAVTGDMLKSYDVNEYDLPPEGWTPPRLQ
jgi:ribose transport system substrate-binding protein